MAVVPHGVRYCLVVVGMSLVGACGSGEEAGSKTKQSQPTASNVTKTAIDAGPRLDAAPRLTCSGKAGCMDRALAHHTGGKATLDFVLSAKYFARACTLGDGRACYELSRSFVIAKGVAYDKARATQLMRKSCQLEFGRGCLGLGRREAKHSKAARDLFELAKRYLAKACAGGSLSACYWAEEVPPARMGTNTMATLDRTCGGGVQRACMYLANLMDRLVRTQVSKHCPGSKPTAQCYDNLPPSVRSEVTTASKRLAFVRERITKNCKQGDMASCRYVRDRATTKTLAERNCNAGDYGSCQGLSAMDPARAPQHLAKACTAKLKESCDYLGDFYRDNKAKRDVKLAKSFYQRACDLGDVPACAKLKRPDLGGGCFALKPTLRNKILGTLPYAAPELVGTTVDNKPFRLSEHRGSVVVLFVSGQFHPRVTSDMEELVKLGKAMAGTKLQIVALVSTDDVAKIVRKLPRQRLTVIADMAPDVGPKSKLMGVDRVPETMLIDAKGQVRVYLVNDRDHASIAMQRCVESLQR